MKVLSDPDISIMNYCCQTTKRWQHSGSPHQQQTLQKSYTRIHNNCDICVIYILAVKSKSEIYHYIVWYLTQKKTINDILRRKTIRRFALNERVLINQHQIVTTRNKLKIIIDPKTPRRNSLRGNLRDYIKEPASSPHLDYVTGHPAIYILFHKATNDNQTVRPVSFVEVHVICLCCLNL